MKIKFLFYALLFLIVFISGLGFYFYFFLFKDYHHLIHSLIPYTHSENQIFKLKNQFLTPTKFQILKYFILFISIIGLFLVIYVYKIQKNIISQIEILFKCYNNILLKALNILKLLSTFQKWILIISFIFLCLLRLYFTVNYPLTYDEIYIWEEFVQRGIFVSISYYPIHGNHIFQTLLVNLFSFLEPVWALRLPSLITASVLDTILFIWLYHKSKSFTKSLLGILLFNLLYVNFIHSFLGRGYQLALLFSIFILILYEKKWNNDFFYETIIIQILLLYTLPSGLFFLISIWIVNKNKDKILFQNIILTGLGSFILYLPVFFFLNFHDLLKGAYYQNHSFKNQLKFFNQIWQIPDFWNIPYEFSMILTILILWILIKKWNDVSKILGIYLIISIILGLLTSFPAKAFMLLSIIVPYLLINVQSKTVIKFVGISGILLLTYSNKKEFETQFQKHFQANHFAENLIKIYSQDINIQMKISPYNETDIYHLNIRHVYQQKGFKVHLDNTSKLILIDVHTPIEGKVILQDSYMKLVLN